MVPRTRLMASGRSRWQVTLRRALRILAVVFVAFHAVIILRGLGSQISPWSQAGAGILLLAAVIGMVDVGWGSDALVEPRSVRIAPTVVAVLTVVALALATASEPSGPELLARVGFAPPIIAGYVAAMMPRAVALVPLLTLVAVMPLTALALGRSVLEVDDPLGPAVLTLVGGLGALFTIRALRRCAYAADRWVARAVEAQRKSLTVADEERAAREVERFIHDEVMHALRAVALGPGLVSPADIRRLAADVLARFDELTHAPPAVAGDGGGDEVDLAAAAQAVLGGIAPDHRIDAAGDPQVPAGPAGAMVAAMAEAVRNTVRHSGAPETLRVEVRATSDGATIRVEDQGRGFDVPRHMTSGFGLARSVRDRMREIGGSVVVRSRPGEGTVVILTWTHPTAVPPAFAGPSGNAMFDDVLQGLALGPVPALGWGLFGCLVTAGRSEHPGWLVAATVAVMVVAMVGVWLTGRGGPGPGMAVFFCATCVGAIIVNALSVPPGPPKPEYLFLIGPATQPLFVALIYRPLREVAPWAVLTAVTAIVATVHVAEPGGLAAVLPALAPGGMSIGVGLVFRAIGNGYRVTARSSLALMTDARARISVHLARRRALETQVGDVMAVTRGMLEGIASGALVLGDPETQRAAGAVESRLRDAVLLRDAPATRRGMAAARDRGWSVRIRTEGLLGREADVIVGRLLTQVSTLSPHRGEIDLTKRPGGATPVVSVLVRPSDDAVWEVVQAAATSLPCVVHRDSSYIQILVRASSNERTGGPRDHA